MEDFNNKIAELTQVYAPIRKTDDEVTVLIKNTVTDSDYSEKLDILVHIGLEVWSSVVDGNTASKDDVLKNFSSGFDKGKYSTTTDNKEAFLKHISNCFDGGKKQIEIRNMEIEGMVTSEDGFVVNMACYLALFGKREGLLI